MKYITERVQKRVRNEYLRLLGEGRKVNPHMLAITFFVHLGISRELTIKVADDLVAEGLAERCSDGGEPDAAIKAVSA